VEDFEVEYVAAPMDFEEFLWLDEDGATEPSGQDMENGFKSSGFDTPALGRDWASETPARGLGMDETPRGGLGLGATPGFGSTPGLGLGATPDPSATPYMGLGMTPARDGPYMGGFGAKDPKKLVRPAFCLVEHLTALQNVQDMAIMH
jgi:hypothetical protein